MRRRRARRSPAGHGGRQAAWIEELEDRVLLAASHPLDLSSLDGRSGVQLEGIDLDDFAGEAVSFAGDINGDGIDDIVVGASGADPGMRSKAGESYVVFGQTVEFSGVVDLSTLDGVNGFRLEGQDAGDESGRSASSAGDFNGDGFGDLIIGAHVADPYGVVNAGETYVIFGTSQTLPATVDLATLDGSSGFRITGIHSGDESGRSVNTVGDFNGDGIDDIAIGAWRSDVDSHIDAGATYIVFGTTADPEPIFDLARLDGSNGLRIEGGHSADWSGCRVSSAGDINGDGVDDLLIGAFGADPEGKNKAGASYVVFGSRQTFSASLQLSQLDGSNGFLISGINARDYSGISISTAGDFNGDGLDDLLVGASGADPDGMPHAGETYVIFGDTEGFSDMLDLSQLDGDTGLRITGIAADDQSGSALATVGDVNGDGIDDILIGAFAADPGGNQKAGEAYVVYGSTSGFAADMSLATLDEKSGLRIVGLNAGDNLGRSVGSAGDINADGLGDIVIGAWGADPNGNAHAGQSYVIFGSGSGFAAGIDLASLDGANGFQINGALRADYSGFSVSTAGDFNNDGFDDILIGAFGGDPQGRNKAGETYVVFGKNAAFPPQFELSSLDGSNGFRLDGIDSSDESGRSVGLAGDVNGDGVGDLLIGAPGADPDGVIGAGESYLVLGRDTGFDETIELSRLDGTNGLSITGFSSDGQLGSRVSGGGDVDGDGLDDVVITAGGAGESYVVLGRAAGLPVHLDASALNGTDGFRLAVAAPLGVAAHSVSLVSDFNGDGLDEILVEIQESTSGVVESVLVPGLDSGFPASLDLSAIDGLRFVGPNANGLEEAVASGIGDVNGDGLGDIVVGGHQIEVGIGAAYVVYGRDTRPAADVDLASLDGLNGFRLEGIDLGDLISFTVSGGGDIDGDGLDDIVIGAPGAAGGAGATYVVFGQTSRFDSHFSLSTLDGSSGLRIDGGHNTDHSGGAVDGGGDFNGDGLADVLVGARQAARGQHANVGRAYVVFGDDFRGKVTHAGTRHADHLVGDTLANVFVAGGGDDTIESGGGPDVIYGGAGDDTIVIDETNLVRVDGGGGRDRLVLGQPGFTLDLSDSRLSGFEVIDMSRVGPDTLILNQRNVVSLSQTSNSLTVLGTLEDTVFIDPGWTLQDLAIRDERSFRILTRGEATLLVQEEIRLGIDLSPDLGPWEFLLDGSDVVLTGRDSVSRFPGQWLAEIVLRGSDGDDRLSVGALAGGFDGPITIDMKEGDDWVDLSRLDLPAVVNGSAGNDTLTAGTAADTLNGGGGHDELDGGPGDDQLNGNRGNDRLLGQADNDRLLGGGGRDTLLAGSGHNRMRGHGGADLLVGGSGSDWIDGGSGPDRINGRGSDDRLHGGAGADQILGGAGRDSVRGGSGDDTLRGHSGADSLFGDSGNDRIIGVSGTNFLSGDSGDDALFGGTGRDLVIGGTGRDRLNGGPGEDLIIGSPTAYDSHTDQLAELLYGWAGSANYLDRVSQLTDDRLLLYLDSESTVHNDFQRDTLEGGGGRDWFFESSTAQANSYDLINDNTVTELVSRPVGAAVVIPAFPGAQGYAATATGGRGGEVIEVTNLDDEGLGSLRAAVEEHGPRIIVFRVGGTITLHSELVITNPDITIAGQTAPGEGVTVRYDGQEGGQLHGMLTIATHNVVLRHLRLRRGEAGEGGDSLRVRGGSADVLIDHVSLGWGTDENLDIFSDDGLPIQRITVQDSLIGPGLDTGDGAAMGVLVGGRKTDGSWRQVSEVDLHGNVFVHNSHRNPRVIARGAKIVNNVVYNWKSRAGSTERETEIDWIGNVFLRGPQSNTSPDRLLFHATTTADGQTVFPDASIHISGNLAPELGFEETTSENWSMINDHYLRDGETRTALPLRMQRFAPLPDPDLPITVVDASGLLNDVSLANIGATSRLDQNGEWVAIRDPIDEALLADVASRTGPRDDQRPSTADEAGAGYDPVTVSASYADDDHDGMSDVWETRYLLDPSTAADGGADFDLDGWTNIEEFLNGTHPRRRG